MRTVHQGPTDELDIRSAAVFRHNAKDVAIGLHLAIVESVAPPQCTVTTCTLAAKTKIVDMAGQIIGYCCRLNRCGEILVEDYLDRRGQPL